MNENDKILIVKYITGQSSEEETAMVKYLIGSSKVHEDFYVQYYEAWQKSLLYDLDAINTERAYSNFLTGVGENAVIVRKPIISLARIAIAASVILICAIGIYFYQSSKATSFAGAALAQNEINVPKGSTRKTVLPDGTIVWINAGTVLKFDKDFGHGSRTVYLDGEAYFDIAEHKSPFIVKTNRHTIRDIGTIFNVKAYADDLEFETAVIEGEVSIEGKLSLNSDKAETVSVKQQQVLKLNYAPLAVAGEKKSAPADLIEAKVQKVNSSQLEVYTGWTEDLLVFEGKTFQEISKIMERKYDVEIVMNDIKLKNYAFTGSFKKVDKVEKALQILKETTDINYEQKGRIITIWGSENLNSESL
ncbi:FecR family protein [Daejeonella lutea]|nr:FecR family protein [Daejeonella lutea]